MNDTTEKMKIKSHELYEKLKTERDELKLQAHLMKAELSDKWDDAEKKWAHFKSNFSTIKKGGRDTTSSFSSGFSALGYELSDAYTHIKKDIKSNKPTKK